MCQFALTLLGEILPFMEMKLCESKSVSVSEIVHTGRTYSSPFLNSRQILGVKYKPRFCAFRGNCYTSTSQKYMFFP